MDYTHILKQLLDRELQISVDFLTSQKFKSVLVYDIFNDISADWLSKAISLNVADSDLQLTGYVFDDLNNCKRSLLENSWQSIISFANKENLHYSILTNKNFDFVVYFSQFREVFIYCGMGEFLKIAYPVSSELIKAQYFINLELEYRRHSSDRKKLEKLWHKYSHFLVNQEYP